MVDSENPITQSFGRLRIESPIVGAIVRVDGEYAATCRDKVATELELSSGLHTITISKHGYETYNRSINITPNAQMVVYSEMAALPGTLIISSNVQAPSVYVDGIYYGRKSNLEISVPAGTHTVTAKRSGYHEDTKTVSVLPGESQKVNVFLYEIPTPKPTVPPQVSGEGMVCINIEESSPYAIGAEIYVDGTLRGTLHGHQNSLSITLPAGSHEFLVTNGNYGSFVQQVIVHPYQTDYYYIS
ncbi:PEGA domain-containing protein [Methanoculleus oceani]|uniref:PEGA domain-containing protein n=1 Tax=Methanoculleus oceani TaxID=2184756 RepID=UPI0020332413